MMESDGTRELLKDAVAVKHAGHKLIELQRAAWPALGFDADLGCQALDQIDGLPARQGHGLEVLEAKTAGTRSSSSGGSASCTRRCARTCRR